MDENNSAEEQSEVERIGRHLAPMMPSNAWLLIYLGPGGAGPLKTTSPLPVEFQRDMARAVAQSFDNGKAEQVLNVLLEAGAESHVPAGDGQGHHARANLDQFLDELLTMGSSSATVKDLGRHPSRADRWEFAVEVLGKTLRIDVPANPAPAVIGLNRIYVPWDDALNAATSLLTK